MGLHWGAPVLKSLMPEGQFDERVQSLQVDPHNADKRAGRLDMAERRHW